MKKQRQMVKSRLCLRRVSGQLSTIPVTSASTLQNSLSMPSTSSITKKMVAQITEPGSERTWTRDLHYEDIRGLMTLTRSG